MPAQSTLSTDAMLVAARDLWRRGRVAEAESRLRRMHAADPAGEDAAMLLAEVLRAQGKLDAASRVLLESCSAAGFQHAMSIRCAQFVQQCDRHPVAEAICKGALAHGTPPANLLAMAGHVARELGEFDTARARYLAAIDAGADLGRQHVLGALANTRRYADANDRDIARFERQFHNAAAPVRSRASAGFALGKARNDLADFAIAAGNLRQANAMVHAAQPWDGAAWRRFIEARLRGRVAAANGRADPRFTPVFVTGVPRTGTTLTASLLARATGARDRGELRALRYIAGQLSAGGHLANPAALAEAADLYRTLAVQDDAPTSWYIDQDPLNFRWLDIAAAMFPQARVIHLRRDRRDTALSLWSQDFAHPDLAFAYDFDDMQAYMAGHDALMRHWHQTLAIPILELDYEVLVADAEATLAKLGDFIGAPAASAAPDDGKVAPVQSASVWQARQPVYATSVGRWKHYAPYVPELARFAQSQA